MYKFARPKIKQGDKLIVGLGDSFVQGVGAYSDKTYNKYQGKIDVHTNDRTLIREQYENSWVNQLCKNHLQEWIPVNFGHAGTGNRCAIKELYLNPWVDFSLASDVIVVLMLSGLERFDFAVKEQYEEHHFYSMWPNPQDPGSTNKNLWQCYHDDIYSEQFIATELLVNLFEIEMFCRANKFKLIVTSAFDMRFTKSWLSEQYRGIVSLVRSHYDDIIDKFDWTNVLYPQKCTTFMELLCKKEGFGKDMAMGRWFPHFTSLDYPSEYLTNCAHPTVKGHALIAEEIYKFIQFKNYL